MWWKNLIKIDEQLKERQYVSFFFIYNYIMIKNWLEFITEAKQLDIFTGTIHEKPELIYKDIWPILPETIIDNLLELEDNNYHVEFEYGFSYLREDGSVFYDNVINSYTVRPSVKIEIYSEFNDSSEYEDLSSTLRSFYNRIKYRFKSVKFYDSDGPLELKDIILNGGIFIKTGDSIEDELSIEEPLFIQCDWFDSITLNDKQIIDYYQIEGDIRYDKNNSAIVEIAASKMIDWLIESRSDYVEVLEYEEVDSTFYDTYLPDHYYFFEYYLDSQTIEKLLRFCFKDWDNLKKEHPEEDLFINYESLDNLILSVNNPKKSANHNVRNQIGSFLHETQIGNDIYNDLRRLYSNMYNDQKALDDYNEIVKSFDKIVEDSFKVVKKFQKEVQVKSNDQVKTYQVPAFQIKFDLDWVSDISKDALQNQDIEDIISDYCNSSIEQKRLTPRFSDYADIDVKEFNEEAQNLIKDADKTSTSST